MIDIYAVYYRYKLPNDKSPGIGAVKLYRLYATSLHEAKETVKRQANYPHITVMDIRRVW